MYRLFPNTSSQAISHAYSTSYDNQARGWKNELSFRQTQEMCISVSLTASRPNVEPKLPCYQQLQGTLYPRENRPKGKSVHSPSRLYGKKKCSMARKSAFMVRKSACASVIS